jgi:hypothetical protein
LLSGQPEYLLPRRSPSVGLFSAGRYYSVAGRLLLRWILRFREFNSFSDK